MKLSSRFALLVVAIFAMVTIMSIAIVSTQLINYNAESMKQWGKTLTSTLAEGIASDAINGNVIHATEVLTSVIARHNELEYAFLTDFDGHIFAYSFEKGFPEKLLPLAKMPGGEIHNLTLDGVEVSNISYPVIEGMDATLHIGLNQTDQSVVIKTLVSKIGLATLIMGSLALLVSVYMSRRFTSGIEKIAYSMSQYGTGNKETNIELEQTTPEASQLARAFQGMIAAREKAKLDRIAGEELLERIFNNTHTMMAYLDTSFNFIRVNQSYLEADNKTAEQLIGFNHFDLYPNEENEAIFRQVLQTGKPYFAQAKPFEYANNPDKGVTHWNWSLQPIDEGEQIIGLLLVLVDVTEQINAQEALIQNEEALRSSKELNETIIAGSPVGISIYDPDGHCIAANKAMADIIGATTEQVLAQNFNDIESWRKSGLYAAAIEVLEHSLTKRHELTLTTTFGKEVAIDVYLSRFDIGNKPHLLLMINDISERRRADKELHIKDAAIEASINPIVMSDMDGYITYVNSAYVKMLGFDSADEIIGKSHAEMSKSAEEIEQTVTELLDKGAWVGEIVSKRKDGTLFDTQVSANIVRDQKGRSICMMAAYVDVSERKQMLHELTEHQLNLETLVDERTSDLEHALLQVKNENEERKRIELSLVQAKNEAEQANRLKSDFLGRMSHELRTPMNAILGFSQLLETEQLNENQLDFVKEISNAGQHLLGLINEVLDLSRIESGSLDLDMEYLPLGEVILDSIAMVQPLATSKNITVNNLVAPTGRNMIYGDMLRYKEVLVNLLSNAIKYGHENGNVEVDVELLEDGIARISVSDDGPGIPENQRDLIFEPFNRLGAEYSDVEGTGIGLTIARQLMEKMNGRIGLSCSQEKGSTFWIEGTVVQARRKTVSVGKEKTKITQLNNISEQSVIYVEDNQANLRLVQHMFKRLDNVSLYSSPNAELGVEMARARRPAIILLDINLPGMDGYEALSRLQGFKETAGIPVIAVSAAAMTRDIERGLSAGFKHYITKPINVDELMTIVRRELEFGSENHVAKG